MRLDLLFYTPTTHPSIFVARDDMVEAGIMAQNQRLIDWIRSDTDGFEAWRVASKQ